MIHTVYLDFLSNSKRYWIDLKIYYLTCTSGITGSVKLEI